MKEYTNNHCKLDTISNSLQNAVLHITIIADRATNLPTFYAFVLIHIVYYRTLSLRNDWKPRNDETNHEKTMLMITVPEYMGVALLVNGFEVASIIRKSQDIKR
jgi:hypothetical protein